MDTTRQWNPSENYSVIDEVQSLPVLNGKITSVEDALESPFLMRVMVPFAIYMAAGASLIFLF